MDLELRPINVLKRLQPLDFFDGMGRDHGVTQRSLLFPGDNALFLKRVGASCSQCWGFGAGEHFAAVG